MGGLVLLLLRFVRDYTVRVRSITFTVASQVKAEGAARRARRSLPSTLIILTDNNAHVEIHSSVFRYAYYLPSRVSNQLHPIREDL